MSDVEPVGGAALRRGERRLRSWLRHEWMTVAMVLAKTCHHSSGAFPLKSQEMGVASRDAPSGLGRQQTGRTGGEDFARAYLVYKRLPHPGFHQHGGDDAEFTRWSDALETPMLCLIVQFLVFTTRLLRLLVVAALLPLDRSRWNAAGD